MIVGSVGRYYWGGYYPKGHRIGGWVVSATTSHRVVGSVGGDGCTCGYRIQVFLSWVHLSWVGFSSASHGALDAGVHMGRRGYWYTGFRGAVVCGCRSGPVKGLRFTEYSGHDRYLRGSMYVRYYVRGLFSDV